MLPHRGAKVVADHNMWPYFARRFGISVIGLLSLPGLPPDDQAPERAHRQHAGSVGKVILANPYFDPRFAQFVAERTGRRW
jgi:ABC-type Zn uptake system ZnuABC Zn-binding protein ZnuA